jgi:hypothetical protein
MRRVAAGLALVALMFALVAGVSRPAFAEFFGCNDKPGKVLASYTNTHGYGAQASARYTHEFAAQTSRRRITIHPRRTYVGANSKRHCRSWLAKEYRISGPVIVPRQQCWWD